MASPAPLLRALHLVQYLTPFLTILYFFVASAISLIYTQGSDKKGAVNLHRTVSGGLVLFTLLYIAQAGLIIDLIFVRPGIYGSDPTNLHALMSALAWLIISCTLASSDNFAWYPYYGSWLIALGTEVTILALSLATRLPDTGVEYGLFSVQGFQIVLLLLLSAVFFSWRSLSRDNTGTDEETAPLLSNTQENSSYATAGVDGSTEAETLEPNPKKSNESKALGNDDDSDSDSSDDEDDGGYRGRMSKKQKQEKFKEILKQDGGWFGYVKGFSVFLPYIWPARSLRLKLNLFVIVLCLLLDRLLTPLAPIQLGRLVNSLSSDHPQQAFIDIAIYILITVLMANISRLQSWLWLPVEANTAARLEKASYNHIMELSCDFHDSKKTGSLFQAMQQGQSIVSLIDEIGFTLLPQLADFFIALGTFYYLFGSYMTLIGVTTGTIYILLTSWSTAKTGVHRRRLMKTYRDKYENRHETVGNWTTVAYFSRIPHSEKRFSHKVDKANKAWLLYSLYKTVLNFLNETVISIGQLGALVLGVYRIVYLGAPVGSFVTLQQYWGSLVNPMTTMSSMMSSLVFDLIDAEALLKIWNTKATVIDGEKELVLNKGNEGHVVFDHVCFKYETGESNKDAIDDLTFEAQPGQTIALVGETGAGKSTVLKLLFRFFDITSGTITIDGQDIRGVTLQSLREKIGSVPQDPVLFNTTIMQNLRYARLDATDEEVYDACRAAAIHDKIMTFPKRYAAKVGERGIKLSGGEKQRIAIARAILMNPPIVLLDEATSAVDSETEAKIQQGLQRLCHNRTTFVVAHRLSTIQHADRILVISNGKIAEQGKPSDLLEQKGKYFQLWTRQLGIFDAFAPKKEKTDALDSDQSTVGGNEEDLIDLNDPEKLSKAAKDGGGQQKSKLSLDTRPSLSSNTSGQSSALSPAKSPSKAVFRPEAPEFIPRNRRSESQSEDNTASTKIAAVSSTARTSALPTPNRVSDNTSTNGSNAAQKLARRGQSQSESGTSSTSQPASRPGSSGPGLLALQQASGVNAPQDESGQTEPKR